MADRISVSKASDAARQCLTSIQELIGFRRSPSRLMVAHLIKDGHCADPTLEPFRAACARLKDAAASLADVHSDVWERFVETRVHRGPCTIGRFSAQTAHEQVGDWAKMVLKLLHSAVSRHKSASLDTALITQANIEDCHKSLEVLDLDRTILVQLEAEVTWEHKQINGIPKPVYSFRDNLNYKTLTDIEKEVLDYIVEHGPKTGKEICNALGIEDEGSFRSHFLPKIRAVFEVKNRRGVGYFIDQNIEVTKR